MKTSFESMTSFADAEASVLMASRSPEFTEEGPSRRSFLKSLSGSAFGATVAAAGFEGAGARDAFEPLWDSAQVFIGNSSAEQSPSSLITCPMFFLNGQFANAFHSLDLSLLRITGKVRGTATFHKDTIELDFSSSVAAAVTQGTDGFQYLLVAGKSTVSAGIGYFSAFNTAIARCQYKVVVDQQGDILLKRCVDCVLILVRKNA